MIKTSYMRWFPGVLFLVLGALCGTGCSGSPAMPRQTEGQGLSAGLDAVILPREALPKGFRLSPWHGVGEYPYIHSNPHLSQEREFVHALATRSLGLQPDLASKAEEGVEVGYWYTDENGEILECSVIGLRFADVGAASRWEEELRREFSDADAYRVYRGDAACVLLIRGHRLPSEAWEAFIAAMRPRVMAVDAATP